MIWATKVFLFLFPLIVAQQKGTSTYETKPSITIQTCTASANLTSSHPFGSSAGNCQTTQNKLTIDANWRWLHNVGGYTNCYTGTTWNPQYCPDPVSCAKNCALDGADYQGTYGVTSSGSTLSLKYVTNTAYGPNVGSRLYLMEGSQYKMFRLKNREFTMDVDASQLPCGLNGAVYFVEMPADGGMSKYPTNSAGAEMGTGYCDAQCPHDIKFINGEANIVDGMDFSKGGHYGTCCAEMDIWEANKMSEAYTTHSCAVPGGYRCEGTQCSDPTGQTQGNCDQGGCDHNPYRAGHTSFYGPGSNFAVDTTQPITFVTQFLTVDGTDNSPLKEIKRFFIQNGKIINNPDLQYGSSAGNSLTDGFCAEKSRLFGETDVSGKMGGLAKFGEALDRGMVLALSFWDDGYANMLWLDSQYPLDKDPSAPGVTRGSCSTSSGKPSELRQQTPDSVVKYSNIKFGAIGTTF